MNSSMIGFAKVKMNSDLLEVVKPLMVQRREFIEDIRVKNKESDSSVDYVDNWGSWMKVPQAPLVNKGNSSGTVINYKV